MRDSIINEYFRWLCDLVCANRYSKYTSYEKLLARLHSTTFVYSMPMDENRADDGVALRYRFAVINGHDPDLIMDILEGPCSVLEMMIALAVKCEEGIMDDPIIGDRTGQWFWGMIANLGLGGMMDSRFDRRFVDDTITRFLERDYNPDGSGGLFTVRDRDKDLRTVEIWYQLCWYLDSIT